MSKVKISRFNTYTHCLIRWVVEHPKMIIFVSLLVVATFALGLMSLQYSPSPRLFQGAESEAIKKLEALEQEYVQDHNILIMIKPEAGTVFTQEILGIIKEFTDEAWSFPYVERVDSITNFQNSRAIEDDIVVEDMVFSPESLTDTQLQSLSQRVLGEPRLKGFLVANDGSAAGINLTLNIDMTVDAQMKSVIRATEQLSAEIEQRYPYLDLSQTGSVDMAMGWAESMEKDVVSVFPATIVLIILTMFFFFRSLGAALAALSVGLLSVVVALGGLGHFDGQLFAPTTVGVLMILILALADTIHVVSGVGYNLSLGKSRPEAIINSVQSNFIAIGLTSVTTAIGFLSFAFSEFSGNRQLGYYAAAGVMAAWLLSITLLPALLTFCNFKPKVGNTQGARFIWLSAQVICYRRYLLMFTVPVVLISLYCLQLNVIDESLPEFIAKDEPFRIDLAKIESGLTGSSTIVYNFRSGEKGGVSNPKFMKDVGDFVSWVKQRPEVRHVASYTETMKSLNKNMHGDDDAFYKLPDDAELAAQYLLFYRMSLPYGLDLTNQINIDESATRVVVNINDLSFQQTEAITNDIEEWFGENAPILAGSEPNGANMTVLKTSYDNMNNMLLGATTAIFIIGIVLLFAFRSMVPGILCVIMVISPIVVTFGIWGLAVGAIGTSASNALCMIIGIVVDNAVHFINKFTYSRKTLGASKESSIEYAFSMVGSALSTNMVVLGAGFSIFTFSAFSVNSSLGVLTVLSVVIALVGTFTLLPSLLMIRRDTTAILGFRF